MTILEQIGFNNLAYEKVREIRELLLVCLVSGDMEVSRVPGIGPTPYVITTVILLQFD